MNWPEDILPEVFILDKVGLSEGLPIQPAFDKPGNDLCSENGRFDWNWPRQSKIYQAEELLVNLEQMGKYWQDRGTRVWVTAALEEEVPELKTWVLLEGDIACMAAADWRKEASWLWHNAVLFLSEDGKQFASLGGALSDELIWMNQPMTPAPFFFEWPEWALLVFSRHADHSWSEIIREQSNEHYWSFYTFCVDHWKDFVFNQWAYGADEAVAHVLETMRLLDAMDHDLANSQFLTVWDDLAIAFYDDHPPKWVDRMWHFMNPLELTIDLWTEEGMVSVRKKALNRKRSKRKD